VSTPKRPEDAADRPTFFIDRDLGRIAFPASLRAAGLTVVTLAEHYGVPADEQVQDHDWMLEASRHGWPVFGCDSKHRKRRRPAERAALLESGLQLFILNGQVSASENVARVLTSLDAIYSACATPGPFVYRVHPNWIERLQLEAYGGGAAS
jgi:hypothetical protein